LTRIGKAQYVCVRHFLYVALTHQVQGRKIIKRLKDIGKPSIARLFDSFSSELERLSERSENAQIHTLGFPFLWPWLTAGFHLRTGNQNRRIISQE
jgi:hypothetical protein